MTVKQIMLEALRKFLANMTSTKTWGFIAACILLMKGLIDSGIWQVIALVFIGAQTIVSGVALVKDKKPPQNGNGGGG